jgi:hypothetical protein
MPEISRFFGIVIPMCFDEHDPPYFHIEYQGNKGIFDFNGHLLEGSPNSKTATRLVRERIDLRLDELEEDWAGAGWQGSEEDCTQAWTEARCYFGQ